MKKSKLIKTIVALAVSIVAAIGCISLVACGGGDPEVNSVSLNKPTLTLQVNGTETLVATTDPAGATVTWSSSDNAKVEVSTAGVVTAKAVTTTPVVITAKAGEKTATCNVTVTEQGGGGGGNGGGSSSVSYETTASVSASANSLTAQEYTSETELFAGILYFTAGAGQDSSGKNNQSVVVDSNTKTVNGVSYTQRIKMGGKGSADARSIKVVLDKGAKIVLHVVSSSSKAGGERTVNLYNSAYTAVEGQTVSLAATSTVTVETFIAPEAGTYYIGALTGGWNVYGIYIYYAV